MTSTVLASIDLTHPEDQARVLKRARQLADLDKATLAVVTVLPDYHSSFVGSFFPEDHTHKMVQEARTALHTFIAETVGHDRETRHIVRVGNVYDGVLETAKELDVSLIVIGAHKPGITDFVIGPNAARVARYATCSVYIVRNSV
ncbi:nucleotide-binding universal stress UspA family protein [Aliiruegeria haliotis]|uniref:Nucleotide-binding universal stress UspA family protein n=1 Tax=Aliiruegeria haliotis TaxID=1280846 RepID=A0A2T0RIN4_9RHOB|nr:universal stress protein [Aliiruegeria haliotis]PRY20960.1 nucleotide-binding universal stress UspA family protein [Aliiruegeria haliotis]